MLVPSQPAKAKTAALPGGTPPLLMLSLRILIARKGLAVGFSVKETELNQLQNCWWNLEPRPQAIWPWGV